MKNQSGTIKLTWSWTGWLWGVQLVTGDSHTQTELHHNIYFIAFSTGIKVIIKKIITIIITKVLAGLGTAANLLVMVVILGHRRVRR